MAFDFKKEYKEFYLPKEIPQIVELPLINYIAVRGVGDPNEENGEYSQAIGILYAVAYTLRMSYKGQHQIEGFYEYVVPPLEGFWWQDGIKGIDYSSKESFHWISVIRLPDFVRKEDFDWAVYEAARKKKIDCSKAEYYSIKEGLCVQIMHHGSYDTEPESVDIMHQFIREHGYCIDINQERMHHEIYLSDPRKTMPEKCRTVIRHPIRKS